MHTDSDFRAYLHWGAEGPDPLAATRPHIELYVRPNVSPQSPTLGLSHLQFEAMPAAARDSTNPCDFALVRLPGLLGLRISEATSLDIVDPR